MKRHELPILSYASNSTTYFLQQELRYLIIYTCRYVIKLIRTNVSLCPSLIIYIVSKLTVVEGDPKATFSVATTPRCRGGHNSFSWIDPLTLDPNFLMLNVKQGGIKYHFSVFGMTRQRIDPRSLGPVANTLTIIRMGRLYIYIYNKI